MNGKTVSILDPSRSLCLMRWAFERDIGKNARVFGNCKRSDVVQYLRREKKRQTTKSFNKY